MNRVTLDSETFRFADGHGAPKLVCVSFISDNDAIGLVDHRDAVRYVGNWLLEGRTIIGHNVAYDFTCLCREEPELLPHVFKAYAEGRIKDTMIAAELLAIARGDFGLVKKQGGFSLAGCCARDIGLKLEKGEERTTFAPLRGIPIEQWPIGHVQYAKSDAGATKPLREALEWQGNEWEKAIGTNPLAVEDYIARSSFALKLASTWGMRAHRERTLTLHKLFTEARERFDGRLRALGILRADGTQDKSVLKALVTAAYNGEPPMTDGGKRGIPSVSTAKQTLIESGDPDLMALGGADDTEGADLDDLALQRSSVKFLGTYFPHLLHGITYPITPGFRDVVVTGRTACGDPTLQNWPTKMGMRGCFTPRDEWLYIDADFSTLELCTFSQSAIDLGIHSEMAAALIAGFDLHTKLGAKFAGVTYEQLAAAIAANDKDATRWRKLAKGPNFGLPGMLGPAGLVSYCKANFGVVITIDEAEVYTNAWREEWPEHEPMFRWVQERTGKDYGSRGLVVVPGNVPHVRGGCTGPEGANCLFQPRAAYGARGGVFETSRRMYTEPRSALYGSRLVNFIHDELLAESPKERAHDALAEMQAVMVERMQTIATPNIPIKTEGYVSDQWE